ncbi:MAG: IS200/IS605 family transposase [Ignavibacteria bacterium]|jgi:REP element-mobilizing transposase RayT
MANTFTQIYIHLVFAVLGRGSLIANKWKNELLKYISGIIRNEGQKIIAINSASDHIHILIGLKPDIALSNLVRDIKANSSRFINEKKYTKIRFQWQEGFGAFSCSHSQLDNTIKYISDQEKRHRKKSFWDEYIEFLKRYNVEYDKQYIFKSND